MKRELNRPLFFIVPGSERAFPHLSLLEEETVEKIGEDVADPVQLPVVDVGKALFFKVYGEPARMARKIEVVEPFSVIAIHGKRQS